MQSLGMGRSGIQGIAKVIKEGSATPTKPSLNVGVRKALAMEEVTCCHSDGMGCPALKRLVAAFQFKDYLCHRLQEESDLVCSKEATLILIFAFLTVVDPEGFVDRHFEALSSLADAEGCINRTKGWIVIIFEIRDYFIIFVVLLFAEAYGDILDVID